MAQLIEVREQIVALLQTKTLLDEMSELELHVYVMGYMAVIDVTQEV